MARSREWAMFRPIDPTPNQVGICGQLEEEQSHTSPAGGVSGDFARCRQTTCHPVREQTGIPASGSLQAATGGNGDSFDLHADSGSHGGCSPRGTAGVASPAEVVCRPSFRSQEAQTTSGGQPLILGVPKASEDEEYVQPQTHPSTTQHQAPWTVLCACSHQAAQQGFNNVKNK